jgi:hypothetical protein
MPGALKGAVRQNVAERHRELLVGAGIGDCGDTPPVTDEADWLACCLNNAQRSLVGNFFDFRDSFETRILCHLVSAIIDYPDRFT